MQLIRQLSHSHISSLSHCGLILARRVELVCVSWSPLTKKKCRWGMTFSQSPHKQRTMPPLSQLVCICRWLSWSCRCWWKARMTFPGTHCTTWQGRSLMVAVSLTIWIAGVCWVCWTSSTAQSLWHRGTATLLVRYGFRTTSIMITTQHLSQGWKPPAPYDQYLNPCLDYWQFPKIPIPLPPSSPSLKGHSREQSLGINCL